jgi:hypothetical protein
MLRRITNCTRALLARNSSNSSNSNKLIQQRSTKPAAGRGDSGACEGFEESWRENVGLQALLYACMTMALFGVWPAMEKCTHRALKNRASPCSPVSKYRFKNIPNSPLRISHDRNLLSNTSQDRTSPTPKQLARLQTRRSQTNVQNNGGPIFDAICSKNTPYHWLSSYRPLARPRGEARLGGKE